MSRKNVEQHKSTGISDYSNIRRGLNQTYKNESFKSGWEQRDSRSIDEKEQDKNLGDRRGEVAVILGRFCYFKINRINRRSIRIICLQ